jgi:NADH-quinone oxidoreductase subunit M
MTDAISSASWLPTLLLLIPLAGVFAVRLWRNRPAGLKAGRLLVVCEGGISLLPLFGTQFIEPIRTDLFDFPLPFLILAGISVVAGIALRKRESPSSGGSPQSAERALLFLFFSAGFLLSPSPSWGIAFWEGILASYWLSVRSLTATSGESWTLEAFRTPLFLSGILFPLSQWLAGKIPLLPLPDVVSGLKNGALPNGAFSLAVLSFLFFCPFFPFQRWMTLHPDRISPLDFLPARTALCLLSTAGILRWGLPLMSSDFTDSLPAFLFLVILAQLTGAVSAWREPSLKRRLSFLLFSQMTIPVQALFWGKTDVQTGIVILEISLFLTLCLMAFLAEHLERTTRRIRIGDMGGLHRELPRSERLFLAGALALAGIPGFGVFIGMIPVFTRSFPFGFLPILSSFAGIFLVQAVLWQTFERVYLGPGFDRAVPPTDLATHETWMLVLFLLPVLFLGFFPGWIDPSTLGGGP